MSEYDRLRPQVRRLLADASQKLFTDEREIVVKKIAQAIADGLTPKDRY